MKLRIISVINLLVLSLVSFGQQSTVILNSTMTGNQNVVARDAVFLSPGFSFTATSGQSFSASINSQLQIPVYSTGEQIVNPLTRALNKSLVVGTLPGEINVNNQGAATYQIPIFISPGTSGMQPAVSLVYNSHLKNGLLGVGWDLAGLSSIQRVPQDYYHDEQVVGVSLQNTDKFALDSNRLVLFSGTYGVDGSIYKTEFETFVQVTAKGTAGTGPSWFEVKTKDGKTLEYGNSTTSKVEAPGSSTVYLWRLNRVKDQSGNYIDFYYNENNGESYIDMIKYTGNLSASLNPYNTIKFSYGTRTDANNGYVAGSSIPSTVLISSIKMLTENDVLVREFQFRYVSDFYTHLNEIIEFGSDNKYLNSTAFGWGSATTGFLQNDAFNNSKINIYYPGDFNGDGRTDFVVTEKKTSYTSSDLWQLWLANSDTTTFTKKNEGNLSSTFKGFTVADVDGNGNDELLWKSVETVNYNCNPYNCNPHLCEGGPPQRAEGKTEGVGGIIDIQQPADTCWDICYEICSYIRVSFLNYSYSQSTGIVRGDTGYDLIFDNADPGIYIMPADFEGNGKPDYLVLSPSKSIYVTKISGVNRFGMSFTDADDIRLIDFDGDGRKEVLVIKGNYSYIYQYSVSNESFSSVYTSSTFPTSSHRIFPGDFNGDNKTDMLNWVSGSGWSIKFSTGTGFVTSGNTPGLTNTDPNGSLSDNNYYIADLNGDGKDDILEAYLYSTASKLNVLYSIGAGIFTSENQFYAKSSINQDYFSFGDFNGDGKKDLFFYDYSSTSNQVNIGLFHKDEMKHLVSVIADGFNKRTKITYNRLNNGTTFYTKSSNATFPVYDYCGAYYAVSKVETENSSGNYSPYNYSWEGAKIHRQGKGFVGFTTMTQVDEPRVFKTVNIFHVNTQYYFSYLKKKINLSEWESGDTTNVVTNTFSVMNFGGNLIFPYVSKTISVNKKLLTTQTTTFNYDNNGNNTSIRTIFQNDEPGSVVEAIKSTTRQFQQAIPFKVTGIRDSSIYTNESPYVRKSEFTYDSNGNLLTEISDPGKAKQVTTTYSTFNGFGLPTVTTISSGSTSRATTVEYDSKARFITKITDPLGNISTKTYNPGAGNINTETGIDARTTTYYYDGFGRLTETITPQSNHINTSYEWDNDHYGGSNSLYYMMKDASEMPFSKVYYDMLGRELKSQYENPGGIVEQEKEYNQAGQVTRQSWPHLNSNTKWTYFEYDEYGRLKKDSIPGSYTDYLYAGKGTFSYKWTGSDNYYIKGSKTNSIGNVIQSIDGNSNVSNTYYSNGQVKQTTAEGTVVTFNYDEYGRQTSIVNPNSGTTIYQYNAFGELDSLMDAKNQVFTFVYDNLGRVTSKVGPDGTTGYIYVTNGNGKGQIQSITLPTNISQSYVYDSYGRVTQFTESIPADESLTTAFTYDNWNNNTTVTYPSGISISKVYCNGYLNEIKKSNGTSIWKLDSINGLDQPVQYSLGSNSDLTTHFNYNSFADLSGKYMGQRLQSFTYDSLKGNLMGRTYKIPGQPLLSESFNYDNYDRLDSSAVYGQSAHELTYDYAGNILTKTGIGSYIYNGSLINRLDSISGSGSLMPESVQLVTYTAENMTSSIIQDLYELQIKYGPGNQRIKTILKEDGNTIKTKYFSLNYEKEIVGSTSRHLHYIYSPYGIIAVVIKQGSTETLYYTETDHLGSIIGLLNPDGTYAEKYSYDAWGRRRIPLDWSYNNVPVPTINDRGFTGHEHLDKFDLINMNGRLYDPVIGRFVSVDPIIQFPGNAQNYNGYGYCLNNPLKYVDPTGFSMAFANWNEFWNVVDNLWNSSSGGSWDSNTGNITYNSDGGPGGSGGVQSGSGFQGSGLPYMLGEVTVAAKAPVKNTPYYPITYNNDNPFYFENATGNPFQYQNPSGGGGNTLEKIKVGFEVGKLTSEAAKELGFIATIGTNLRPYVSGWAGNQYVSTIGLAKSAVNICFWAGAASDATLYFLGEQSGAKTATSLGVNGLAFYLGGVPGIILGGGYMLIDKTVGWERMLTPVSNDKWVPNRAIFPDGTTIYVCFKAGTQICTKDGFKPIERIAIGDSVYSYNLDKSIIELSKVVKSFERKTQEIYELTTDNQQVYVTAEHPFYVEGKGWAKVRDLQVGFGLKTKGGSTEYIINITINKHPETVYNIEVEENHNYFVTNSNILVHNK